MLVLMLLAEFCAAQSEMGEAVMTPHGRNIQTNLNYCLDMYIGISGILYAGRLLPWWRPFYASQELRQHYHEE
jgi:hypothetical protein